MVVVCGGVEMEEGGRGKVVDECVEEIKWREKSKIHG